MKAVYAGSFDPITLGHMDIIRRSANLFDELVVSIGIHPGKKYLFTVEERVALVKAATKHIPNVKVTQFDGLLVDYALKENIPTIVRGIRVLSDFDVEFRMGLANRDISGIETLFLLTDPSTIFVSSSMVKEIARGCNHSQAFYGRLSKYLTREGLDAMWDKYKGDLAA